MTAVEVAAVFDLDLDAVATWYELRPADPRRGRVHSAVREWCGMVALPGDVVVKVVDGEAVGRWEKLSTGGWVKR